MMKKLIIPVLCVALSASLAGCGGRSETTVQEMRPAESDGPAEVTGAQEVARPVLVSFSDTVSEKAVQAKVTPHEKGSYGLEDAVNKDSLMLSDNMKDDLNRNLFAVGHGLGFEFHELYEENKYNYCANFVTVDSLLHTYHLYYEYLQKNVEKQYLLDHLRTMSESLLACSQTQAEALRGTPFEQAAVRNTDYFSLAVVLSGGTADLSERAEQELKLISDAAGIGHSPLFETENEYLQDYTQFRPRGYYAGDAELEKYFRTMMWYGQMNFTRKEEDLERSALLCVKAIQDAGKEDWEAIYLVTAFLAGESDDSGFYEYEPLMKQAYGETAELSTIAKDTDAFEKFHALTGTLKAPKINSMVIREEDDRDEKTAGFRVMGQRFSVDAAIMQKLVYRDVEENEFHEKRRLPDALDVPAALGSEEAEKILKETTDVSRFPDYAENLEWLRNEVKNAPEQTWHASVSVAWLNMLRPLLEGNRDGYPDFMRSAEWSRKDLTSFLGSYTELKHDTVLYQKQVLAELGADGPIPEYDDRGYVEPEPLVYGRLAALSEKTAEGLQSFGMISEEDKEYMQNLSELSKRLKVISEKELREELPSDEEFDLIRNYGATLEHLWLRTVKEEGREQYRTSDFPAALVTDIATDPDSQTCLQIANAEPAMIAVLVFFDGAVHLTSGTVYQFYQFEQPISERMTDQTWRELCESYDPEYFPPLPEWISSYSNELLLVRQKVIGMAEVRVEGLNVRSQPSLDGEKLGTAGQGRYYSVYEIKDGDGYRWYRIGTDRWIADQNGRYIEYSSYR